MGFDISLLETFTLVADLGSFSGAARRQGITQPAVSSQIKALEKEVGARLLDRTRNKIALTPEGRAAYRHARRILDERDAMLSTIPQSSGAVSGLLLIGASSIPGEYLLPPLMAKYIAQYPGVNISLDISDSGVVARDVLADRVELGFVGAAPFEKALQRKQFAEDRLVLIGPEGHRLEGRSVIEPSELLAERIVMRKETSGTRRMLEAALSEAGLGPDSIDMVAEMGSTQAVISAVRSGIGLGVVSDLAAENARKCGGCFVAQIQGMDLARKFYAINLKKKPLSPAAEKFLEMAVG
jgi:DNA-binding transcriptional LysR family regulator